MARVGRSNPPVNLKGREGAVSDSGKLNSTGRSCSAEMVWLGNVSDGANSGDDSKNLLCQDAIAHNNQVDLFGECIRETGVAFRGL